MPGPGARNLVVAATLVGPGAPRSAAALGRLRPAAVRRYTAAVPVPAPWTAAATAAGSTLAAEVRAASGEPWSVVKKWIATGKVWVGGAVVTAIDLRLRGGEALEVRLAAPRPRDPLREADLVHDDPHVVVIDKPAGVSSVPYDERELGTAMDLIRAAWRRMGRAATVTPLHVVHRIDKATSGLLMFAKSKRAEVGLAAQLRDHSCERTYRCVAHGVVTNRTITSWLVADRGDGLRGSTSHANQGKRAVTHVTALERLRGATVCEVRLETGKTHQIRIHLAEAGHPLVGEEVYGKDFEQGGGTLVSAPRLMLHAMTLGFVHPITGERLRFERPPPAEMAGWIAGRR
jgi:23S rRNA pseudouridine1911/1915/1917 synthase